MAIPPRSVADWDTIATTLFWAYYRPTVSALPGSDAASCLGKDASKFQVPVVSWVVRNYSYLEFGYNSYRSS